MHWLLCSYPKSLNHCMNDNWYTYKILHWFHEKYVPMYFQRVSDEDFQDVLLHRIKSAIDPAARMRRNSTSSFTPRKRSLSASPDSNHGFNNGLSPKVLQLSRGVEERQIEVTSPVRSSRNSEQEGESHIGSKPSLTNARTLIL